MKKTDYLSNTLIYALYMFAACLCSMAIETLLVKIIDRFVVLDYFQLTVIRVVIYCIATCTLIFIFAFFEGYREAAFCLTATILPAVFAVIVHFLFSILFRFSSFISGGVKYLSGIVRYGSSIADTEHLNSVGYKTVIPVFIVCGLVYCIIITGAKYLGKEKRLKDRENLTGKRN